MLDETPYQTSPTCKNSYFCVETCWLKFCSGTNFIQDDFFVLFRNFINFVIAQTIPTFHQRGKNVILDEMLGWFAPAFIARNFYKRFFKRKDFFLGFSAENRGQLFFSPQAKRYWVKYLSV